MTDISRKRTLKEFFNGGGSQEQEGPTKALSLKDRQAGRGKRQKKTLEEAKGAQNVDDGNDGDDLDQLVDKTIKKSEKVLKAEEQKAVSLDTFVSAYDDQVLSLYEIMDKEPKLLQSALKQLIDTDNSSQSQEQTNALLKTCFLYFF